LKGVPLYRRLQEVTVAEDRRRISGEYRHYAEFHKGAKRFLGRKEEDPREDYFNRLAALFFVAFGFEGLLNHVGAKKHPEWWEYVERLETKNKAMLLCKHLNLRSAADPGTRPFQTLFECVRRRNDLVHSKYHPFEFETTSREPDVMFPSTERDRYADRDFVERAYADLMVAVRRIVNASDLEDEYPEILGQASE
jgi:hypothetical protein